jgi:tRNA 2-thiouridine synthesizing protein A
MSERRPDKVLDLRGWSCPWCILKAKSWLERMTPGQVLEVHCTDPNVRKNFSQVLERTKDRIIRWDQTEDYLYVLIQRGWGEDVSAEIASLNEKAYIGLKLKEPTTTDKKREDYHGRNGS